MPGDLSTVRDVILQGSLIQLVQLKIRGCRRHDFWSEKGHIMKGMSVRGSCRQYAELSQTGQED